MRVVLATSVGLDGGVSRHVLDLARGLGQRADVRVALALPHPVPEERRQALAAFEILPFSSRPKCDIWHVHLGDTFDRTALAELLRRRAHFGRSVITEHLPRSNASDSTLSADSPTPGAQAAKTLFKRTEFAASAAIVAVSEASASFLRRRYRGRSSRVTVVRNGVCASDSWCPPPAGAGRYVALGSLISQKGYDVLLDAAAIAQEPWTVRVFGEGPHRQSLAQRAAQTHGRVRFEGWTSAPRAEIEASHALVVPSRWESAPYAVLDAMERGRAVIGSAVDGVDEMVEDGRTGVLVPPGDPARLAEALDGLARRVDLAADFGSAGRRAVVERFRLDEMVERTHALYQRVLP